MKFTPALVFLTLTFLTVGQTDGAAIPGLFNTGVDGAGNVLGDDADDPHYELLSPNGPAKTVSSSSLHTLWTANNSTSRWVWETHTATPGDVTRTFQTTFDLTGLDPAAAQISGIWIADNHGLDILINGNSSGNTSSNATSYTNFSITSGFVSGINTLDFIVQDVGQPGGFRIGSISGTSTAIPEPATFAICGLLGMGFLGFYRRVR